MINILFPPGAFGSTLEFCIRYFSNEHFDDSLIVENSFTSDGAMHAFKKEFHTGNFNDYRPEYTVASLIYPDFNNKPAVETVLTYKQKFPSHSKTVLIVLGNLVEAEKCTMFQLYRAGDKILPIVYKSKLRFYNVSSTSELEVWQKREMISYHLAQWQKNIFPNENIPTEWLTISFDDVLYYLEDTLIKIFDFLNLTFNNNNIKSFYDIWANKQTYVLNEIDLANNIMEHLNNNEFLEWNKLSLYGEALLQYKIRKNNKQLRCYGVNDFPTNTIELKSIIE